MNDTRINTPWGWPTQLPVEINTWVSEYAPWLMIGALLVLGWATAGNKK